MGYLGATLARVFTRACRQSGHVTQRCHNSPRWETGLQSANNVTNQKRAEDFWRFGKSQLVEMRPASGEHSWFSLARGDLCGGCHTCWGVQMKKPE